MIKVKSAHARASAEDGKRILVDLFWPEGLKTLEAHVDEWITELGPTYDLQRFHFAPANWDNYKTMYRDELLSTETKKQKLRELADMAKTETITLLYGNRNPDRNHASIVREVIESDIE